MSEITRRYTHWTEMNEKTGKVNALGHYVPPGLHKCQLCQTYDDPRRVEIRIGNLKRLWICWTCAKPHLLPFFETVFDPEELDESETIEVSGTAYPPNPLIKKDDSPSKLPANHPKVVQENINTKKG